VDSRIALDPTKLQRALEEAGEAAAGLADRGPLAGLEQAERANLDPLGATRVRPAPGAADAAGNGDHIGQDAAEVEQRGIEWTAPVDHRRPVSIGHCVLVE